MKSTNFIFLLLNVIIFTGCKNPSSTEESETINTESVEKTLDNEHYWFYVRTSQGGFYDKKGFHYSQILKCTQKVSTPGIFSKSDAVGPFDSYAEANTARNDEIAIAEKSELMLIPEQAVCNTKWD